MRIWERTKAKVEQLLGRAEEVYGQSHGDAAATAAGEAHRLEAEADDEQTARGDRRHPDDDGLAGQGAR